MAIIEINELPITTETPGLTDLIGVIPRAAHSLPGTEDAEAFPRTRNNPYELISIATLAQAVGSRATGGGGGIGPNILPDTENIGGIPGTATDYVLVNNDIGIRLQDGLFYFVVIRSSTDSTFSATIPMLMSGSHGEVHVQIPVFDGDPRGLDLDFRNAEGSGNTQLYGYSSTELSANTYSLERIHTASFSAATFTGLTDTPSLLGTPGQIPVINRAGDGFVFEDQTSTETGLTIVNKLAALPAQNRLSYNALRDTPSIPTLRTAAQTRDLLAGLTGEERLDVTAIKGLEERARDAVVSDGTLTGLGTIQSPLSVVNIFSSAEKTKLARDDPTTWLAFCIDPDGDDSDAIGFSAEAATAQSKYLGVTSSRDADQPTTPGVYKWVSIAQLVLLASVGGSGGELMLWPDGVEISWPDGDRILWGGD